jgi:hypothetical protein
MQHRLAIRHLSGGTVSTIETLVLPPEREITFGRDRDCHVRYDEADDLVSRKHLKIVATDERPVRYMVVDLGSRNGTFVNRQRVFGAVILLPGARIQLGAAGPEFEFQVDTEEAGKGGTPKPWFAKGVLVAFLLVAAGAAGYAARSRTALLWRDWHTARAERPTKPGFTPAAALASVASVEGEWSVFDKQSARRLARAYIANERVSHAERVPLLEGAPARLPAFVVGPGRRIEPLLVAAGTAQAGQAVGGKWTSKGVIVSQTGALLIAAPDQRSWNAGCHWTAGESAGALLVLESQTIAQVVPLAAAQFPPCAPDQPGFFAEQLPEALHGDVRGRRVSGGDLRIAVTTYINASGQTLKAGLVGESSGIWFASTQSGIPLAGIRVPPFDRDATRLNSGQPVWVVGREIEAGELRNTTGEDRIALWGARCREGGVVFDQDGRVLALCIPDSHLSTQASLAIPIRRGLVLLGGITDGQSR